MIIKVPWLVFESSKIFFATLFGSITRINGKFLFFIARFFTGLTNLDTEKKGIEAGNFCSFKVHFE